MDVYNRNPGRQLHRGMATWLVQSILLVLLLSHLAAARAQQPEQTSAVQGVAYEVEIDAPKEVAAILQDNLDLIRWRGNARLDELQLQRLYRQTPDEIRRLVETEGYYAPEIRSTIESQAGTTVIRLTVNPGEPVRVGSVDLVFEGAIAAQPGEERPSVQRLRQAWSLNRGAVFRHADWEAAKTALLREATQVRYPRAHFTETQATVDPATNTAALRVVVNSGDPVRFGAIRIEGLERYPESVVLRQNRIKPGDVYREQALRAFQTRLQDSGYFQSVEVAADLNSGDAEVPIRVTVSEYRRKRIGLGVGYSTNTGNRLKFEYDDLTFLGQELKLNSSITLETKRQAANANVLLPETQPGFRDSVGVTYERTDIRGEDLRVAGINARRAWGTPRQEQSVTLEYLNEQRIVEGEGTSYSQALPLTYGITWRRLDSRLNPTRGYAVQLQAGAAVEPLLTDNSFVRTYMKALHYQPFGKDILILRGELGAVISNGTSGIPSSLLFRAGGDQSVRGYAYQSLGVPEGDAIVGGLYLATASAEYQHWFLPKWGVAAFFDAGNAGDSFRELDPAYGYGFGLRWRSPVGPISGDIAYGERTGRLHLHFSLGFTF